MKIGRAAQRLEGLSGGGVQLFIDPWYCPWQPSGRRGVPAQSHSAASR